MPSHSYLMVHKIQQTSEGFYMEKTDKAMLLFADYPDVVDVKQLSQMLNISTKTAYRLLEQKKINHFRIGRDYKIPKVYVVEYMTQETKKF